MRKTESLKRWSTVLRNRNVLQNLSVIRLSVLVVRSDLITEFIQLMYWSSYVIKKKLHIDNNLIAYKTCNMKMKLLSLLYSLRSAGRHSVFFILLTQVNSMKFSFTTLLLFTRWEITWNCISRPTSLMIRFPVLIFNVRRLLFFLMSFCTLRIMLHESMTMISFANYTTRSSFWYQLSLWRNISSELVSNWVWRKPGQHEVPGVSCLYGTFFMNPLECHAHESPVTSVPEDSIYASLKSTNSQLSSQAPLAAPIVQWCTLVWWRLPLQGGDDRFNISGWALVVGGLTAISMWDMTHVPTLCLAEGRSVSVYGRRYLSVLLVWPWGEVWICICTWEKILVSFIGVALQSAGGCNISPALVSSRPGVGSLRVAAKESKEDRSRSEAAG